MFSKKNVIKNWLVIILFPCSLLYYFSSLFYGLDFTDTFFHINEALYPANNVHRFSFLYSSLFIELISKIFGSNLMVFRIVNGLLLLLPGLLSLMVLRKCLNGYECLIYSTIVILLTAALNTNILGFDTLTTLSLSFIFFNCYWYIKNKKRSISLVILLCFLTSFSILIRLPNIILLLILPFFLLSEELIAGKFRLKHLIIPFFYLIGSIALTLLLYYLYYQDWDLVFGFETEKTGHEIGIMAMGYLRDAGKLVLFTIYFLISYFVLRWFIENIKKNKLVYIIFFTFQLISIIGISQLHRYNFALYYVATSISLVLIYIIDNKINYQKHESRLIILFIVLMFVHPFGSNTGLIKASFFFLMFPFTILMLKLKNHKFWLGTLVIISTLGVVTKLAFPYQDSNFFKLDSAVSIAALSPIKTQEDRAEYLENVIQEINHLKRKRIAVYFYGNKSHIFHYLYPETTFDLKNFNQSLQDTSFYPEIERLIESKEKVAIFLIKDYPENSKNNSTSLLGDWLLETRFKKIQHNGLSYYLRN